MNSAEEEWIVRQGVVSRVYVGVIAVIDACESWIRESNQPSIDRVSLPGRRRHQPNFLVRHGQTANRHRVESHASRQELAIPVGDIEILIRERLECFRLGRIEPCAAEEAVIGRNGLTLEREAFEPLLGEPCVGASAVGGQMGINTSAQDPPCGAEMSQILTCQCPRWP